MLEHSIAARSVDALEAKPKRRGQHRKLWRNQTAQLRECSVGSEACAHGAYIQNAERQLLGQQVCNNGQDVVDQAQPAPDPANGAGQVDSVAAQHVRCDRHACCALGMHDDRFERIKRARQPRGETIGQQAKGSAALWAVPASNACPTGHLAHVGAVSGE